MAESRSTLQKALIYLIKGYRLALSPLSPPCCKYYPTCSSYAIDAIMCHGAIKGLLLSFWRILRCHPFAKGGYDPVPNSSVKDSNDEQNN